MCNPLEPLNFHKNKLENLNIFLKDSKINRLIYTIRNDMYPADEEILRNINHITITYDHKLPNSKDLPFCPIYNKFINPSKKSRLEAFIIITSIFLLKLLINITDIYIDVTFKIAPQNYYQILNIILMMKHINSTFLLYMPLCLINLIMYITKYFKKY